MGVTVFGTSMERAGRALVVRHLPVKEAIDASASAFPTLLGAHSLTRLRYPLTHIAIVGLCDGRKLRGADVLNSRVP